jgi:LPXTG-motif cell wall-anchored protein
MIILAAAHAAARSDASGWAALAVLGFLAVLGLMLLRRRR